MENSVPLDGLPRDLQPLNLYFLKRLTITPSVPGHYIECLLQLLPLQIGKLHNLILPSILGDVTALSNVSTLELTTPVSIPQFVSILKGTKCLLMLKVIISQKQSFNPTKIDQYTARHDCVEPDFLNCADNAQKYPSLT
jgi:hypothetical protein